MWLTAKPIRQLCFPLPISVPNKFCNCSLSITATTNTNTNAEITTTLTQTPKPKPNPKSTLKKRKRYRKLYPGETTGITEEMRFVAMRLRTNDTVSQQEHQSHSDAWQASMEGFLSYLVDSHLIFATLQRIVDESDNVSCQSLNPIQFHSRLIALLLTPSFLPSFLSFLYLGSIVNLLVFVSERYSNHDLSSSLLPSTTKSTL